MAKGSYATKQILNWMEYFSKEMQVSPEKIKLLDICGKQKNAVPSVFAKIFSAPNTTNNTAITNAPPKYRNPSVTNIFERFEARRQEDLNLRPLA